ncbi:MAG: SURF1 family protein [Actinobacteria bacterium]|nr:SURF1 family protein [Actinomycetota bacterium]
MTKTREPLGILKSLVALLLIIFTLWAAQWQYHRGIDRHERNSLIAQQSSMSAINLPNTIEDPLQLEWRQVKTEGRFSPDKQILLRNRYFEGQYGYEVLTLFTNLKGKIFWIDRGWVKAGADATTAPITPPIPAEQVSIVGRFRLGTSLPSGTFFALPGGGKSGITSEVNAQSRENTEDFYLDLLNGSTPTLTPQVSAQLPELSDGPHMAYALQWIFFGGLVVYGRILIRRTR